MLIYIHIGYFKTGSTNLENNFFSTDNNINYLNIVDKNLISEIKHSIQNFSDREFREQEKILASKIKKLSLKKAKINLLSALGTTDVINHQFGKISIFSMLRRLKKIFSYDKKMKIKIFVTVRKHEDFIISRYSENIYKFYKISHKWGNFDYLLSFFNQKKFNKRMKEKKFFDSIKYYLVCREVQKIFGKKNLHVLLYEDLKYNPIIFSKKILKILKLKKNKDLKTFEIKKVNISKVKGNIYKPKFIKIDNLLRKNIKNPVSIILNFQRKIISLYKMISDYLFFYFKFKKNFNEGIVINNRISKQIRKYYFSDNKKLEKIFKLNIKKYNYY